MKTKILLVGAVLTAGLCLTSCKKDEDKDEKTAKPVVTLTELGHDNSKVAHQGKDLHVEADVVAEGKIAKISIQIHPEGVNHSKTMLGTSSEEGWEFDTTFTEFKGLKNTTFHKHLDISKDAEAGHYHFHFTVTDQEGQQTMVGSPLEIKAE